MWQALTRGVGLLRSKHPRNLLTFEKLIGEIYLSPLN